MCLLAFNFDPTSSRPLLLAANRDEFHRRPTLAAAWWPDEDLLAGRDRQAGGTWLAVSRGARLAAVTNVREMQAVGGSRSRGELPVEFVAGSATAMDFAADAVARGAAYGGFNLLLYDRRELWWCSNRSAAPLAVPPGIHGLSNHLLDTPWPKVRAMRATLCALDLNAPPGPLFADLLMALQDRRRPPGELPDTGVGREREELLAPVFIQSPHYGTRCSTLVALGADGGEFLEVSYDAAGAVRGRVAKSWTRDGQSGSSTSVFH